METRGIAEAALLGTAAGIRTFVPLAALGLTLPRRRLWGAPIALASAGELIHDKSPRAGERTAPGPLLVRTAAGAIAGGIVGRALGGSIAIAAATGALAAFVSTFVSHRARAALARRLPPIAAGFTGDLVAIGTAIGALRLAESGR